MHNRHNEIVVDYCLVIMHRLEEEKARKKIRETESRAKEIFDLKERNKARRANVHMGSTNVMDQRRQTAAQNQQAAAESRMRRQKAAEDELQRKATDVRMMREVRLTNAHAIKQQKNAFVTANSALREQIKTRQAEVRELRAKQKEEQERQMKIRQDQRCAEERLKQAEAEKIIQEMEIEEEQLIERLRATQDKQRAAYAHLEQALHA
jgi:hypothetical protein